MLSLSRKVNESIIIESSDGPIEILVTNVAGQRTNFNVSAPKHINVYRKEVPPKPSVKPFEYY